jgi:uncharacterized membrane protein
MTPAAPESGAVDVLAPTDSRLRRQETRLLLLIGAAMLAGTSAVLAAWILRSRPENLHWVWIQAIALATVPGKFAIFGGLAARSPLDPFGVGLLSVAVDAILAIGLALGLTPILCLPGIGTWLRGTHARASVALGEYPRLKRMAFWGVAVFVALPIPGSGWVGGTFASQLLGLSRPMGVAAIVIGSAAVSFGFAGLAFLLGQDAERMLRNPWIALAGLAASLVLVWLLWNRFREHLRRG